MMPSYEQLWEDQERELWADAVDNDETTLAFDDWAQDRAEAEHERRLADPGPTAREDHLAAWQQKREL